MTRYRKLFAAVSALVVLIVGNELGVDSSWYDYTVAALGALAVWWFPNDPRYRTGGVVTNPQQFLVGERGPEVFPPEPLGGDL